MPDRVRHDEGNIGTGCVPLGRFRPICGHRSLRYAIPMKLFAHWPIIPLLIAVSACEHARLPATPLLVGVEGKNYAEGTRLIQRRLQARFPKGSSERKLQEYLAQQGLKVERTARPSEPYSGVAYLRYGGPICGSQVRVIWSSDEVQKLQNIDAIFGDTGCP